MLKLASMKFCVGCGKEKELTEYSLRTEGPWPVTYCKLCMAERSRVWQKSQTQEERRNRKRLSRYKLTPDDLDKMWDYQDGNCGLCDKPLTIDFHIDHNRKCCPGEITCGRCVRGLLHRRCNTGLGNFDESIELLEKAILWLKQ